VAQGFLAKEYHLGCHKLRSFVTYRNQLSFKLLINYQNIMKMKQKDFCHSQQNSQKHSFLIKIYIFIWLVSFVVVIMLI